MRIVSHRAIVTLLPVLLILSAITALVACGDHLDPSKHGIVFSPNGLPLSGGALGHPNCQEALGAWYDRVATAGSLKSSAFIADAKRQFAAMDVDHVGLLTPAALSRYRAPYVFTIGHDHASNKKRRFGRDDNDENNRNERHGGNHDSSDDLADPVMSADRRNRNEVDLADFVIYAGQNFAHLDTNHDGQISREELLSSCPQ